MLRRFTTGMVVTFLTLLFPLPGLSQQLPVAWTHSSQVEIAPANGIHTSPIFDRTSSGDIYFQSSIANGFPGGTSVWRLAPSGQIIWIRTIFGGASSYISKFLENGHGVVAVLQRTNIVSQDIPVAFAFDQNTGEPKWVYDSRRPENAERVDITVDQAGDYYIFQTFSVSPTKTLSKVDGDTGDIVWTRDLPDNLSATGLTSLSPTTVALLATYYDSVSIIRFDSSGNQLPSLPVGTLGIPARDGLMMIGHDNSFFVIHSDHLNSGPIRLSRFNQDGTLSWTSLLQLSSFGFISDIRIIDGDLICGSRDSSSLLGMPLASYDVHTGQLNWSRTYQRNGAPYLSNEQGRWGITDLKDGTLVVKGQASAMRIDKSTGDPIAFLDFPTGTYNLRVPAVSEGNLICLTLTNQSALVHYVAQDFSTIISQFALPLVYTVSTYDIFAETPDNNVLVLGSQVSLLDENGGQRFSVTDQDRPITLMSSNGSHSSLMPWPLEVAIDSNSDRFAYITNNGKLSIHDLSDGQVISQTPLGILGNGAPRGIGLYGDGDLVVLFQNEILRLNPITLSVLWRRALTTPVDDARIYFDGLGNTVLSRSDGVVQLVGQTGVHAERNLALPGWHAMAIRNLPNNRVAVLFAQTSNGGGDWHVAELLKPTLEVIKSTVISSPSGFAIVGIDIDEAGNLYTMITDYQKLLATRYIGLGPQIAWRNAVSGTALSRSNPLSTHILRVTNRNRVNFTYFTFANNATGYHSRLRIYISLDSATGAQLDGRQFAGDFSVPSLPPFQTRSSSIILFTRDQYSPRRNVKKVIVSFPFSPNTYTITSGQNFGGNLNSLAKSDNDRVYILCDTISSMGAIEVSFNVHDPLYGRGVLTSEGHCSRPDVVNIVEVKNPSSGTFVISGSHAASLTDMTNYSVVSDAKAYISPAASIVFRQRSIPFQELEDSDGWIIGVDQLQLTLDSR